MQAGSRAQPIRRAPEEWKNFGARASQWRRMPLHDTRPEPLPTLDARLAGPAPQVGIVGLGHVGLPLALAFVRAGARVRGHDTDERVLASLARHETPLAHLDAHALRTALAAERLTVSADAQELAPCDVCCVCVPTPLGPHREPDLAQVESAARALAALPAPGERGGRERLLLLCSTTYPGTTRDVCGGLLSAAGRVAGRDYELAYAPEREDPGRSDWSSSAIPRIVGGTSERSGALAQAFLARAFQSVTRVSSAEVAESAKLLENVFRAVNIALVNELKWILSDLAIDIWEVVDAAATKPFGFMRFEPGPGMGGHCIPIDPFYLAWAARKVGRNSRFIELAGEINREVPQAVVQRMLLALNERGRALRGARVLLLGVAYKREVSDVRESPALALLRQLRELGAELAYSDPHVPRLDACEATGGLALESQPLSAELLASFDAVVLATDHAAFDYALIARASRLLVDTRGALRHELAGQPGYVQA